MGGLKTEEKKDLAPFSALFSLFLKLGERPSLNLHYAHRDFLFYAVEYLTLHKTSQGERRECVDTAVFADFNDRTELTLNQCWLWSSAARKSDNVDFPVSIQPNPVCSWHELTHATLHIKKTIGINWVVWGWNCCWCSDNSFFNHFDVQCLMSLNKKHQNILNRWAFVLYKNIYINILQLRGFMFVIKSLI